MPTKEQEALEQLGAEYEPDTDLEERAQSYARAYVIAYTVLHKKLGDKISGDEFNISYLAQSIVDGEVNHRRIMERLKLKYGADDNGFDMEVTMPDLTEIGTQPDANVDGTDGDIHGYEEDVE